MLTRVSGWFRSREPVIPLIPVIEKAVSITPEPDVGDSELSTSQSMDAAPLRLRRTKRRGSRSEPPTSTPRTPRTPRRHRIPKSQSSTHRSTVSAVTDVSPRIPKSQSISFHSEPAIQRLSASFLQEIWSYYHGDDEYAACYCCGEVLHRYNNEETMEEWKLKSWSASMVIPDAKGGRTTIDNLRTCCSDCHVGIQNRNLYSFIRTKKLEGPGATNVGAYMRRMNHGI